MVENIGVEVTCGTQAGLMALFYYQAPTPENYITVDSLGQRVVDESKNDFIQTCTMVTYPNYPFFRIFDSKDASRMTGITDGPFYAVATNGFVSNGSFGGPAVTEKFEILTAKDGTVVPGLYGAGEFCNINVMGYDFPHHGCNLQYCLTSGRGRAQSAVEYIG